MRLIELVKPTIVREGICVVPTRAQGRWVPFLEKSFPWLDAYFPYCTYTIGEHKTKSIAPKSYAEIWIAITTLRINNLQSFSG